jgi:hypothetical protein
VQPRGLERTRRQLAHVARLRPEGERAPVDLGRQEDPLDNVLEPVGLRLDDPEQLPLELGIVPEIRAPERADSPVHGRERRTQLVRGSRDELAARALELPLPRGVLEHQHATLGEAALTHDEEALDAVAGDRRSGVAGRELGHDPRERPPNGLVLGHGEVARRGRVPVADGVVGVDEDDGVVDVLERAGRAVAALGALAEAALDVVERPDPVGHREQQPDREGDRDRAGAEDDGERRPVRAPLRVAGVIDDDGRPCLEPADDLAEVVEELLPGEDVLPCLLPTDRSEADEIDLAEVEGVQLGDQPAGGDDIGPDLGAALRRRPFFAPNSS